MTMPIEHPERIEETIAVLGDPATMQRLAASDAELARGEAVSANDLADAMSRRASPSADRVQAT